jgi:DNA-binding MarR family transcriptional regulator
MHPRDLVVLGAIADREIQSQRSLAEQLGINRTIMVKLLDKLEEATYVTRQRNPEDRRSAVISVTDAGRAAIRSLLPIVIEGEERLTKPLDPVERERLNDLLDRLLPQPAQSESTRRTGYLIAQAHLRLRRQQDLALAPLDLQSRHFNALMALTDIGACSQQEFARILGIAEPPVVQIADDLILRGLVSRRRASGDRRRYVLELTAVGNERLAAARDAMATVYAELLTTLGQDNEEELRTLLTKLIESTGT